MITQYQFVFDGLDRPLPSFWAYRLYAWLLTQVPPQVAEELHEAGEKPLSQHLLREPETGRTLWVINLLEEEIAAAFRPVLEGLAEVPLHTGRLQLHCEGIETKTAYQLVEEARSGEAGRRMTMQFLTPTAFKTEGRYAIFPQAKWLVRTLAMRWSRIFPELPLEDPDALAALERGITVADYALHTTRYPLKNIRIPSFLGNVTLESRLAAPMEEIWQLLLRFAPYVGVGIKTTLGMGGVRTGTETRYSRER